MIMIIFIDSFLNYTLLIIYNIFKSNKHKDGFSKIMF